MSNNRVTPKQLAKAFLAPILVLSVHLLIFNTSYYVKYPWIDIPSHFFGGVSIYVFLYMLIYRYKILGDDFFRIPKFYQLLIVSSVVSLFAMSWEFLEWLVDYLLGLTTQDGLDDTMLDMFLGLLGGMLPAFVLFRRFQPAPLAEGTGFEPVDE